MTVKDDQPNRIALAEAVLVEFLEAILAGRAVDHGMEALWRMSQVRDDDSRLSRKAWPGLTTSGLDDGAMFLWPAPGPDFSSRRGRARGNG